MNKKSQISTIKTAKVISAKMTKALVVEVQRIKSHPLYSKNIVVAKKYHVYCDDSSKFKVGQIVKIKPCRPHSKTVTWEIVSNEDKEMA